MKVVIAVLVVLIVGVLAYNYGVTGELRLMPPSSEERQLARIEKQLDSAKEQWADARKAVGKSRDEVEKQIRTARREVERLQGELEDVVDRLEDARDKARTIDERVRAKVKRWKRQAHDRADRIGAAIEAFKRELQ